MNIQPVADRYFAAVDSMADALKTLTSVSGPAGPDAVETSRLAYRKHIEEAGAQVEAFFDELIAQTSHATAPEPPPREHPPRRVFFGEPSPVVPVVTTPPANPRK